MIARWAIAPLHHPLNRYAVTGGALRRFLVDFSCRSFNRQGSPWKTVSPSPPMLAVVL